MPNTLPAIRKRTPAARALVGALALQGGATTNEAFKLAGYKLTPAFPDALPGSGRAGVRVVTREGRKVTTTSSAHDASFWLTRLGQKLQEIGVGKAVG